MGFFDFLGDLFKVKNTKVIKGVRPAAKSVVEPVVSMPSGPAPTFSDIVVSAPGKKIEPIDLSQVNFDKSPNQSARTSSVLAIVLHHTGPGTFKGIVNWLKDPVAKASAHYVVGRDGELTQLVNTSQKAWHAGGSAWTIGGLYRKDINNCTVGIEICNIGLMEKHEDGKFYYKVKDKDGNDRFIEWKGKEVPIKVTITYPSGKILEGYALEYPEVQVNKVIALCKALVQKYPDIGREDILTHFQIATPEGRKNDPLGLNIQYVINKIFE